MTGVVPLPAAGVLVSSSVQPDLLRPRELPLLRECEAPRHFIDLELLGGNELPQSLSGFLRLLARLGEDPHSPVPREWDLESVGVLPYALTEQVERLAALYALLRLRPEDPVLQTVSMHTAGFLAHYAQDLCQPLHTTVHHDGRARRDYSSPRIGMHRLLDGLLRHLPPTTIEGPPPSIESLMPAVLLELERSHRQVDLVYVLASDLEELSAQGEMSPDLTAFAHERYEQAVRFTAALILHAWKRSSTIEMPGWAPGSAKTE